MPGPMHGIIYIHNATHKEVNDFEQSVRELNREDSSQVSALLDQFKFFRGVLKVHEGAEEKFFFPVLEKKFRYIAGTYLFDHNHHTGEYDEVEALLTGLTRARGGSEQSQLARQLNRLATALAVGMDMHITKENELILPVLEEHWSIEEQGAMVEQAMSHIPPDLMMQIVPWMFKAQNVDDREGFLREGMEMFPPEQFKGMAQMLSQSVPSSEWQEMVRRIPELP